MVVCPGISSYSAFKQSIGFDIKRIQTQNCPSDSVRDCDCLFLYKKASKSSSPVCEKCSSLKWLLANRKKIHDEMPPSQRVKRQSSNSSVPFDVLSPDSQKVRVKNMRKTIKTLRSESNYYSQRLERLTVIDNQNSEIGLLVGTIVNSKKGQEELTKVFSEAEDVNEGMGKLLEDIWENDYYVWTQFKRNQEANSLAIFSRSPAAYHAVQSLGILNLPCDRTLRNHMSRHSHAPGIDTEVLCERAEEYEKYKEERVNNRFVRPVGILIWDEVKGLIRNSSNSSIIGYAMSSDEFISLHDVYLGIAEDEKCQRTLYMLQFLWRDLSSDYDVVGPYFNCPYTMETQYLHSMVVQTILAFCRTGFFIRSLLCDGASSNLCLLKLLCGYMNDDEKDIVEPWFKRPFDGSNVYLIVCPSHQLKNVIAALYSSRVGGTKQFFKSDTKFGWSAVEAVYQADLSRAKVGISRLVPGLKYSYVVRDSWTRLNVLPAKIMQQPYMIAAIRGAADKEGIGGRSYSMAAEYLQACSMMFENGILCHEVITSPGVSSKIQSNMAEAIKWFSAWKEEINDEADIKFRSPLQKKFLAWQTWDLLRIMYHGFNGLCKDFLTRHPQCFISPIRLNGSAVESIFSCLKYIAGGNLSSSNYATSLTSLITQKDVQKNPYAEKGYRTDVGKLH